jgi:hypothetical protein
MLIYPREMSHQYPLDGRLGEPKSWSELHGEVQILDLQTFLDLVIHYGELLDLLVPSSAWVSAREGYDGLDT